MSRAEPMRFSAASGVRKAECAERVTLSMRVNGWSAGIIGYDEVDNSGISNAVCSLSNFTTQNDCESNGYVWAVSHKSGSHYLIVGPYNNYTP